VLPTTTKADYLEGESIAYLVDFLEPASGRVRFRVYFHDVPSDGPFGKIPDDVLAQHEVDLALLCAGNWNLVEHQDAVSIIRNLRPRHVLIGHWENFFKPQDEPPLEPAPLQPVGLFRSLVRDRMEETLGSAARRNVVLPKPQVLKTYPVRTSPS